MARTLEKMLRIASTQARKRSIPSDERMRWINTIAYLSQTYNGLLRDTEVNELKEQLTALQEKLERIARPGHQ
jgi:hypothetical protein